MQTAGDYAVSAFFFFLVALFVRDTASDHFCSKSRTACTLGFSQKCSSLSDAQISRPNLIVLLRATSYVRHGLPQNHVRLSTLGLGSSRTFLAIHLNIPLKYERAIWRDASPNAQISHSNKRAKKLNLAPKNSYFQFNPLKIWI